MPFATGDIVWVFPKNASDKACRAKVDLVSSNQCSMAVQFDDRPEWMNIKDGPLIHHRHTGGLEMFLYRKTPSDLWADVFRDSFVYNFDVSYEQPKSR